MMVTTCICLMGKEKVDGSNSSQPWSQPTAMTVSSAYRNGSQIIACLVEKKNE